MAGAVIPNTMAQLAWLRSQPGQEAKKIMESCERDPRWERLLSRDWYCSNCTLPHRGLQDLACPKPDHWQGSEEQRPNSELANSDNILTEDFCILNGEHFFVRCILRFPLTFETNATFGFGVWSTLSKKNFGRYIETFDSGEQEGLGPWFGWFSNRLKGYPDTLNIKCQVYPQAGRQRPLVEIEDIEHPLAIEQRDGITLDRLIELFELNGHSLKNALSD